METLVEAPFIGKWKSFKTFKRTGSVVQHSKSSYTEFLFDQKRELNLTVFTPEEKVRELQSEKWCIDFENRRHYLSIQSPKHRYEVITINHTVMVLMDPVTQEKTFFAREEYWNSYLETNKKQPL